MKSQLTFHFLIGACLCLLGLFSFSAVAQSSQISIPTNMPQTVNSPIMIGDTMIEFELNLNRSRRFALDIILPVDGASIKLVDKNGNTIITSNDPGVDVTPGDLLEAATPLPGAVFYFSPINTPIDIPVKLVATFPPATEQTVMVTTVLIESKYQSGIALSAQQFFIGDAVSLGFLLLNDGSPIIGASVILAITNQSGETKNFIAKDDGLNGDGSSNDGIYTVEKTFDNTGVYTINGSADFMDNSVQVTTQANGGFTIIAPMVTVEELKTDLVIDSASACVSGLTINASVNVSESGEFIFYAGLLNTAGKLQDKRKAMTLTTGSSSIILTYTQDELLELYGPQLTEIVFTPLGILAFDEDLTAAGAASAPEILSVNQPLCSDPVVIGNLISVEPLLVDNSIQQLAFTLGVSVDVPGNYQVSFKIVDTLGADIILLAERRSLSTGFNEITFSVNNTEFMNADGPYQVLSGLVLGPAGSANKGNLGISGNFNRWQFVPVKEGDLDNDGAITTADRSLLLQYRNQPALVPGDRRDLNNDGKIDIKDIRALSLISN